METNVNFEAEEKKAGRKAASTLRNDFRNQINRSFHRRTGTLEKSTVTSRYRDLRLDRLVINSPRYSFQNHFGSTKSGTQGPTTRRDANVRSFQRHITGKTVNVAAHTRSGGSVVGFNKNRTYRRYSHIARALQNTSALNTLATELGENRIVLITSQINF